jgi:hypothetical protein
MSEHKDGPWKDEAVLRELYCDEEHTTIEIAERFDISGVTVVYWMEKHDIDRRDNQSGMPPQYTDEELLDWIDSFVEVFGVVPTSGDINAAPGPSIQPYRRTFGSWTEAVNQAGYEPRGNQ